MIVRSTCYLGIKTPRVRDGAVTRERAVLPTQKKKLKKKEEEAEEKKREIAR